MRKELTPEEKAALAEGAAKLSEEARLNWKNPQWHAEMAAVLTEQITVGFEHENVMDLLTDVQTYGEGDRVTVSELKGLRVFQLARGGYIEESTVREDVFDITRDTFGFHVSDFEDKMQANFGPEVARIVELGKQRMASELNLRVLRTFQEAVAPGDDNYVAASGLDLDTLNQAIRTVKDESQSEITIIGRASMTEKIIDGLMGLNGGAFAAYLPETNEAIIQRGGVGRYRGVRIVELRNYKDDNDKPFFPGNELWVVGRDASKFAFWGAPKEKEWVEQDNWFWHYAQRRDFGGVVYRPERLFRIVDTTEDE